MQTIIIIKGSPGVGKSYISKNLVSKLKGKKISIIPIDNVLHFDQRKLNEDKLKLSIFHTAIMARSFLRENFDVIIEYTFDISAHLEFLIDKIKNSHTEKIPASRLLIFHLSATLKDIKKRNKSRRDGSDPLPEIILERLFLKCEKTAGLLQNEFVIDTSMFSSGQVLKMIMEKIK